MKTVRAKYPISIRSDVIPKDAIGQMVTLKDADNIREFFPNLCEKEDGELYLVKFPSVKQPFLCGVKQVEVVR